MEVPVYNMSGEEVDRIELPADIFEANVNRDLMHQALVRQLANKRLGTHQVKGRSDVNRSTRKIYRQKGTGNARHGSRKAPIFVGGGIAHGPQPRSYEKKMPRKMRRAALRSALTIKATNGNIVVLDDISMDAPKTKEMVAMMQRLNAAESALLLLPERNETVELSARNLPSMKALRASYVNIRDLLGYNKLVMPLAALDVLNAFLGYEDGFVDFEDVEEEE
jgi:large subunit ribosomal protein L4